MKNWEFSETGDEFIIGKARLPRHWYNYLWNDKYVALFSHLGNGYSLSQDKMGNRADLVSRRMLFLRDFESSYYWSANALPVNDGEYQARHGLGYSIIKHTRNEIKTSFRVFVPQDYRLEIWTLRLENLSDIERHIQIFSFVDSLVDGPEKPQNYYLSRGYFDTKVQAAIIDSECAFENADRCYSWLSCSEKPEHYDTRQSAFIGYGSFLCPDALEQGSCFDSETEMEKPILALEVQLSLQPNEQKLLHFFIGTATSIAEINEIKAKYFTDDNVEYQFNKLKNTIKAELGKTRFKTKNHDLDSILNFWLKRQITLGVQWARVRHNGYRDLMQDIAAYSFINPKNALMQFKRVLAYQYADGHAPRTFLNGKLLDKDFSDNHVWIIFAAYKLILETGKVAILAQKVDFNDGSNSTIFGHLKRALDYLWNDRGERGLSKLHSGDWNDGLDRFGSKGRAESVWLSFAFLKALRQFEFLAGLVKKENIVKITKERIIKVEKALESAREDNYFVRAFGDDGRILGSKNSSEATFFLNSQTWAVLSGKVTGREAVDLLELCDEKLMTDIGVLSVENAFSKFDENIALMSRKTKGIQENGGIYLHASAFKLVADAIAKRCDAVEKGIRLMLPFDKNGEPYVFSNSYYAIENSYQYGQSGQSWGTGTAAWFYYAMLNYVFGIKPTMSGIKIEPCLPKSWNHVCVKRYFREKVYHINYSHSKDIKNLVIFVDGKQIKGNLLPFAAAAEYHVEVIIPGG